MYNISRRDQLASITYNDGTSENFSYDGLGNPTTYRSKTLTWSKVNQLTSYNGNTFTYDGTGKRISKNSTTYVYAGDKLIKEIRPNNVTISYLYGLDGIIGFKYGVDYYFYQKNLQGDVIEIIDRSGLTVANYTYDAWGNHKIYNASWVENSSADFIGNINPIRYRGYYYDTETGLYYLQTRYYDPEIGHFISPDSTKYLDSETLGGLNLYSYCINNPINFVDSNGCYVQKISSTDTSWLSINDFKNKDGTYSLYDNTRDGQKHKYHEQIFVVAPLSSSVDVASGFCIGGSFTIFTGGWEGKNNDLSLFDFGRLTLQATWEPGYKSFEFGLSIWSPSYTFKTESGGSLTLGLNLGLIFGGTKSLGKQTIHLGIFSISWSP